ncbi:alkaline phosphatase D [Streptoalloteichus tenebrarius]|uniref:Alkaline phosphatase D n=1 Tax=Streptoalloteichus tenebrarius (strain ATCC 17920 / DSM 40477 / JCM 4838 / CBS 697.72 / NBRC 16177 / NCIMB 11028 / NRRL B-12390 / A12253. 1 / ISP 5477) TaxID=1933 RepID=A0ABT1HX78_STRSD|nr:alkaline phosphatase D family protein [Streptoalloteichus tenebrarius]MCP2260127.1 alkaline phosphatase D [Streptoalloteichus tenebrarius]BFF00549.1 alkaline phosphatase D family protein [Streptoalloteichus tenebrarius]
MENPRSLDRRSLLRAGAVGAAALAGGLVVPSTALAGPAAAPALVRGDRPRLTHGVQCGDVTSDGALVWTRADRPSRMLVDVSFDPSFRVTRTYRGPLLTPDTDGTGKLRINHLPPGRRVHYRVRAEDLDGRACGEPVAGSFRTAPVGRDGVRFVWSGDIVGQGWGINPDLGGMTIFSAMAARQPDFFLCSGDTVYADSPLAETVTMPDGRRWRNLVTPEKSKVAETLAEFRGQFAYNLLDEHYRRFAASVPQINQWDDHEVTNNWYPGEVLADDRYTEKRVDVLAARAFQAFHEWVPLDPKRAVDGRVYRSFPFGRHVEVFVLDMRTYRDANSPGTAGPERILGEAQARWLVDALRRSHATWKVIAADLPLGLVVPDGTAQEGIANGQPGAPAGREAEIAWVLREIARRRVRNVVWLTADVHYTAAHHYSPDRAAVRDFDPFWEFVSGPLHAGAFGPNKLDPTFGPEAVFVHAPPAANTSPWDGFQHFGEVEVDGRSGDLTVHLRDAKGASLWSKTLRPQR